MEECLNEIATKSFIVFLMKKYVSEKRPSVENSFSSDYSNFARDDKDEKLCNSLA